MDIVMTGYAGLAESIRLAVSHREKLLETLPASYLDDWLSWEDGIAEPGNPEDGKNPDSVFCSALCCIPIGEGGLFRALWQLAEELEQVLNRPAIGLAVVLDDIPICQETIEICERLNQNPYQLPSGGWLLALPEGKYLPGETAGKRIGSITEGKARRIFGKEGIRYLEKPRQENTDIPE